MFANLRESAGTTSADFNGDTVGAVIAAAVDVYGGEFERGLGTAKIWVNGDPAGAATPVTDGDEIALIPPVSGGTTVAGQQSNTLRAGLVVALVLALAFGNFISTELFVFVTVGAAMAWLWDVRDALLTRGAPIEIIPVMAAAAAGANGAYGWGSAGLAAGLAVGLIVVLSWSVLDPRSRSIDAIVNAALLGVVSGLGTGSLVLVNLRNEDEVTLFLVLASATVVAAWAAGRFASASAGLDPNVAGLLAALAAGIAAAVLTDVLTFPVMILAAVGVGAGFIAGRALGSVTRIGTVVHTTRAPGLLTMFDGPIIAAGAFWVMVVVFT
jgi:molybdopterin converting factor small subunit